MQLPREVIVGKGTLERVPEVVKRLKLRGPALIIAGKKSCEVAGQTVRDLIAKTGMDVDTLLVETSTIRDVLMVEERILEWKPQVIFGVGGGTKIDVAKLSSAHQEIPFISVPTTVSHDGIASPLASIRGFGKPYSVMSQAPLAIIADTEVIAHAPWRSVVSGCGDVIAK
ncbi:MAG: iron-containing alcohol dehydrogenase, partial [Candidatus Bathyarchaeia archaeon]